MFSRIYGWLTDVRNSLYERGVFASYPLGAKTFSIGNITVGGTGKTPLVALVAGVLAENGERVAILTRGYGRADPRRRVLVSDGERILTDVVHAGDEPLELARKLLGRALVIADADRVAAARWARENYAVTALVLDDAFQHRRARRDLDIVCVDATNPFGSGLTLPGGILREPLENLARADAIIITRANLVDDIESLKSRIRRYNSRGRIFVSKNRIARLIEVNDFRRAVPPSLQTALEQQQSKAEKSLAFCALGNPNNFFEQLRRENFDLTATESFPDHHFYTAKDVEKITAQAVRTNAKRLLTTAKDAVKLENLQFEIPLYVVESALVFDDEEEFRKLLLSVGGD